METVRYFWHGFIHRGTTFMYLQYSPPLIYHLLLNVWTPYTISASIFVDVPDWPLISCVVPGPSQWLFHFRKEIVIAWTRIGSVRWMFQNLPLPWQQKCDSLNWLEEWWGSVPWSVVVFSWIHAITIFSPKWKNPVRHKRWTYPCYREHQQRLTHWWCTMLSKHLAKGDK